MNFSFIKSNPSKFRIPPRNTCLLSNVYDIPCISPSYEFVDQCSRNIEEFQNKNNNIVLQNKKYLFTFVEENIPNYIKLNIESFNKYYQNYNLVIINKNNVRQYLPDFPFNLDSMDKISMIKKIDFLKYSLLYNYGGLWIDSSVLLYKKFEFNKYIFKYDFIVFSNPNYNTCLSNNILELPNTKIMFAKKKLDIIKYLLNKTCQNINKVNYSYEYNNQSEKVLYDSIKLFQQQDSCNKQFSTTNILQLPSFFIGKMNSNKKIMIIDDYIKQYKFKLNPKSFCTIIDNNENYYKSPYELFHKNIWFLNIKNELLNSGMFISYLYRLNN